MSLARTLHARLEQRSRDALRADVERGMLHLASRVDPAPAELRRRHVEDGPIRWHVTTMGRGPAVLLVHGTGASSHSLHPLMQRLAERFTVVAPDLPGHALTRIEPSFEPSLPSIARAAQPSKPATTPAKEPPLFTISLAEWSLHRKLQAKELDNLDFPKVAKNDFGIDAVEYVAVGSMILRTADGDNWRTGHWLNGRLGAGTLATVIAAIAAARSSNTPGLIPSANALFASVISVALSAVSRNALESPLSSSSASTPALSAFSWKASLISPYLSPSAAMEMNL